MKEITPKKKLQDGMRPTDPDQSSLEDDLKQLKDTDDKSGQPKDEDDDKDLSDKLDDLHDQGKEQYRIAQAGWKDIRDAAIADQEFYHGNQWEGGLKLLAQQRGEPVIEVNRLPTFVKQIENELRQREMSITLAASDEDGSDKTADILTGIVRGIEQRSNAKAHYIHAAGENGALVPGFGFLKVSVDYSNNNSFDQDITIKSVKDPMTILPDPHALEADFSDAEYWFETVDYPWSTFKKLFPFAQATSLDYFSQDAQDDWAEEETVRVCRYWYKKETATYHFLLDDGTLVTEKDVDDFEMDQDDPDEKRFAWVTDKKTAMKDRKIILRKRKVSESEIRWCDMTGAEILDEGGWAGKHFPFVAVTGPISIVNGKRDIRGIIRFAKDSQKLLNYFASSTARRIASANKSPWIVAKESIVGYEKMWNNANKDNMPYLLYNATNPQNNGNPNPVPQRADQTGQIQDLLEALGRFETDLKATIGIYDAGLGATPNEQSGVAIKTLAQQGQNANFHFSDNLTTGLRRLGEILIDLIPTVYDTARVVKTVGAEGQEKLVRINDITKSEGESTFFDVAGAGSHYGVTINVGPAYATAKQAAVESMLELIRVNPQIAPYVQDIIAQNMDFNGKDAVAERLQKVLAMQNPQLVDDGNQPQVPPQAQAKMAQMGQQLQQMSHQLQQLQTENQKMQFTLASKQADHQATLQKAQLDHQAVLQKAQMDHQNTLTELQFKGNMDQTMESMRAQKDAVIGHNMLEVQALKAQMDHNTKMTQMTLDAIKHLGAGGPAAMHALTPIVKSATMPAPQPPPVPMPQPHPMVSPIQGSMGAQQLPPVNQVLQPSNPPVGQ
jgi:hypothetical protein